MSLDQGYVVASWPDASLFNFPPTSHPAPLAPAAETISVMRPFNIPESIYSGALDPKVPLTIAALYAITAKALNMFNSSRNKKPWAMSKTKPFFAFVVAHNVFLAVYSAWTFWGMLGSMRRSIISPFGPGGLAATADSFCRIHGPAGIGRSIFYNDTTGLWDSADPTALATGLENGAPSNMQMGRIWAEGLNFYGWLFYISKFYEVLDTFIILAKGKFSSTLQTYHHAGAMLCMWAGMRYMSAPIWVFVQFNSFIHALMYTYYTLSAFSIRVPMIVKRTLTTMQITQFVVGASYAIVHSFVSYVAPITVAKPVTQSVKLPAAPADTVLSGGALDSIKQLILGAAGAAGSGTVQESTLVAEKNYVMQSCIPTANETFAIWLNVLYLAPLTYLFVSFFIASYVKRSTANNKIGGKANRRLSNVTLAEKAGWDAARGLEREVYGGENMVNGHANGHIEAISEEDDVPVKANGNGRAATRRRG